MRKSYKMKHLFIIGITIALFAGLLAANELNQPAEKVQSVETNSLSADGIITAFTFLLGALTVMATLFGIFIGYIGYKSSKEYEKEVARAEQAANRAEMAAKIAESAVGEIRQKGHEAIEEMQAKFSKTAEDISSKTKPGEEAPSEKRDKLLQFVDKVDDMYKAKNYEGVINSLEAALMFNEDNAGLWHLSAVALLTKQRFQEALEKITTAINKNPNNGFFYDTRSYIKLSWWRIFEGPKPSKNEIIKDVSKAIELGFNPDNATKEELAYFLDNSEYEKLLGKTKEEDGFGEE